MDSKWPTEMCECNNLEVTSHFPLKQHRSVGVEGKGIVIILSFEIATVNAEVGMQLPVKVMDAMTSPSHTHVKFSLNIIRVEDCLRKLQMYYFISEVPIVVKMGLSA